MQITEQPSLYDHLEKKSVREILEDINQEDQKVALAVQKAIPQIEELVNQIVPRMKQGDKMVNMQLSNHKLVERGTRMIMEELGLNHDHAQKLLLLHGSVKNAIDAYRYSQDH